MVKKYKSGIDNHISEQKSHHEQHIKTSKHKQAREIERLKMMQKNQWGNSGNGKKIKLEGEEKEKHIEKLLDKKETIIIDVHDIDITMNSNISNREALKEKIHEIHNFLRNNGAGYGMAALKVFNIFYGLKRIEENKLFDKVYLSDECKFSYLLEKSKGDDDELANIIYNQVLESLSKSKLSYFLFYEIPTNMKGKIFSHLINELDKLTEIEKSSGEQLTGKIYEYFIGRDKQAISELGAYFTNRLIVDYIYKQLELECDEDGSIGTMVDPFGGSGGFTTGYINWMKEKYPDLDWSSEINKIHHYDMNEDVIKSAALEFFCITGEVPNMEHLQYKNSFTDEFKNMKFKNCITNPPYGGDKNNKSDAEKKREKIKKYIKEELKTLTDKDIIKRRNEQLKHIDNLNKLEKKRLDEQKVTLEKSSIRIKKFAKKYGLKGNDKEAVSLILMMDMVEEGGIGCGVLKEGVFFNKTYKNLRKCLLERFNVTKVISIPSDQFENTSTKTSIIIFKNTEEKTSSVQFYDLSCVKYDKDKLEEIDGHIVLTENEGDVKGVEDNLVSIIDVNCILNDVDISFDGKKYKASSRSLNVNNGYITEPLGVYCDFKPKTDKPKHDQFSLIKIKDIDNGQITANDTILNKDVKTSNICKANDILISTVRPKSSKMLILTDKYNNIDKYCFTIDKIRVKDINPMYIYAMLYIFVPNFEEELCTGSSYPTFNIKQLENYLIPIPKDKQKMIEWSDKISEPYNEKLDKENIIQELEKELQERVKYISENEDCEEKTIGELFIFKNGYGFPSSLFTSEGIPLLSIKHIPDLCLDKCKYITEDSKYIDHILNNHELILAMSGNTIGKYMIYRKDKDVYCNQRVGRFTSKDISPIYLYNLFNIIDLQKNIIELASSSAQPNISYNNIKHIKLKIPKNKQLITDMEPQFKELEQLHVDVKNADKKYKDLIEELKNEAIKQ